MIFNIFINLKKEIVILLTCISLSIVLIVFSYNARESAYQKTQISKLNLKQAREKHYTSLNQKLLLDEFEPDYNLLKNSAIIGAEDRLNWIENLDKISQQYKIPYLKYNINKRQKFLSNEILQTYPAIELYKSNMSLQLQLLHEGDLNTVLNSLNKMARGLFDIYSCTINRNPTSNKSIINSQTDNNFTANCILNWYSIQKKSAPINKTGDT